ncbi:MAG: transposase [Candidatus Nanopelagicales bacterium]|jgi:hypothetical protein|nr:transposase [Candidatus Nanopelagicales bacterium]
MAQVRTIPAPVLKELSGVSVEQFARLVDEIGQAWETARFERLERPGRQRVQGAGRKHAIPFAARLLMVLMYLRWNISYRALGGLFGVSKDAVLRSMNELLPLLAARGITAPDGTVIADTAALEAQLATLTDAQRAALVDGTFVPVGRPRDWDVQKPLYNHHRGRHTRNFTALTDDEGRLLWVGGTGVGSLHDLTAVATSTAASPLAESKVTVLADKAYRGIAKRLKLAGAFTPKPRRRKDRPAPSEGLAAAEKDFNREIAKQRVKVEHAIRRLKVRRVLHGYRLHARRFDDVVAAVAGLTTMPA